MMRRRGASGQLTSQCTRHEWEERNEAYAEGAAT